jgi:serine O-acetyltransferase
MKNIVFGSSLEEYIARVQKYKIRNRLFRMYAVIIKKKIESKFNCYIALAATFGKDVCFPHPVGIIIGEGAVIGDQCKIYQSVTLGAKRSGEGSQGKYPTLGSGVTVFAGAVLIGGIKIGNGTVIGANSVVLQDCPDNSIVVGNPGRLIVKKRLKSDMS